jgi:hypothetical protein
MRHRERAPSRDDAPGADRRQKKSPPGPPMTLGGAAAAQVRLIVWCRDCGRQVEPDPAELARQYGEATSVLDWRERLVVPTAAATSTWCLPGQSAPTIRRLADRGPPGEKDAGSQAPRSGWADADHSRRMRWRQI